MALISAEKNAMKMVQILQYNLHRLKCTDKELGTSGCVYFRLFISSCLCSFCLSNEARLIVYHYFFQAIMSSLFIDIKKEHTLITFFCRLL